MALTPEQRKVLQTILRVGKRKKASAREVKAAVETGLVEANLTNPDHGDKDSVGWRQERSHYGPASKRMNVAGAASRFFDEADELNTRGGSAGQLAQRVQRSAYPGRYDQKSAVADALLRRYGDQNIDGDPEKTETVPGVDRSDQRRALKASYLLSNQRYQPGGLLALKQGLDAAGDTPSRSVPVDTPDKSRGARKTSGTNIEQLLRVARRDFGLTVREHPAFDKVDPVHVQGSYHYRKASHSAGAAGDVSGPPERMAAFADYVARNYGRDVEELIWRGKGARTIKRGRRVPASVFSGHQDHVHVADVDG